MTRERWIFAAVIALLLTLISYFLSLEVSRLYGRVGRLETAVVQILNARQSQLPITAKPVLPLQKAPEDKK